MIALKIVKWKVPFEKMDFADLVKDAKVVTCFCSLLPREVSYYAVLLSE